MASVRERFLLSLLEALPIPQEGEPAVLIGIDGVDGAGKTVLADELGTRLASLAPVERISIDGFHHDRAVRYHRGRRSAKGFWLDSYDYEAFRKAVVDPFRAGTGTFLSASHDLESDAILTEPRLPVRTGSIVVVDGIFLHRPELREVWDFSLFLDVPFAESVRRLSHRDGTSPIPSAPENRRYVEGQRIYLTECAPASHASLVIDYADVENPRIMPRAAAG
ncbi:uridine kinase [Microbacterium resistens]|uniref:Uridine kinase n=1 Tax=Microbacterium resistens TaxID=156977 RepID=A0ABU1SID7_9MICO|nr:uridine kinase [Microbacterium resistens]MDR6868778.1 uridine kinase [Microbacterium resistens]